METLIIGQHNYTIGRLNALDQLHVSRKIAPIVPKIMPILTELAKGDLAAVFEKLDTEKGDQEPDDTALQVDSDDLKGLEGLADALGPLMNVFSEMAEDDVNYLIHKCLGVVRRGTALVSRNNSLMFDDIDLQQIMPLVLAVIRINLGGFIQGLLMKASSTKQSA